MKTLAIRKCASGYVVYEPSSQPSSQQFASVKEWAFSEVGSALKFIEDKLTGKLDE